MTLDSVVCAPGVLRGDIEAEALRLAMMRDPVITECVETRIETAPRRMVGEAKGLPAVGL